MHMDVQEWVTQMGPTCSLLYMTWPLGSVDLDEIKR